eukprot:7386014-Prymnesium_polylepis.1
MAVLFAGDEDAERSLAKLGIDAVVGRVREIALEGHVQLDHFPVVQEGVVVDVHDLLLGGLLLGGQQLRRRLLAASHRPVPCTCGEREMSTASVSHGQGAATHNSNTLAISAPPERALALIAGPRDQLRPRCLQQRGRGLGSDPRRVAGAR